MMESWIRELLKRALAGDPQAAKQLLDKALAGDQQVAQLLFRDVVYPIIERRLGKKLVRMEADRATLRDHVQDVMIHLLDHDAAVLRRWDPERGAFAPFIAKVAKHHVISQLRKQPPPVPSDETDKVKAPGTTPAEEAMFSHLVMQFLRELPDSEAPLFQMIYLEGLSPREAAERLGISAAAAHKRVQRMRSRVSEKLSNPDDPKT